MFDQLNALKAKELDAFGYFGDKLMIGTLVISAVLAIALGSHHSD